ncbi:hypothetical protein Tco_1256373 [Tanacetum coccineum]
MADREDYRVTLTCRSGPMPFRRRVFKSCRDGKPITAGMLLQKINSKVFDTMNDDDVVGLCLLGFLELVLLGHEIRYIVPEWCFRSTDTLYPPVGYDTVYPPVDICRKTRTRTMAKPASESNYDSDNVTHELDKKTTIEIGDEFVKILQDNAFNGIDRGDVIDHIAKILEILEWINNPDVDRD